VLLSFYAFASDDLEELRKIPVLVASGELTLYVTGQVKDEFARRRERVISTSMRELEKMPTSKTPRFMDANADTVKAYDAAFRSFA
jgi:hypothetical protein